MVHIRIEKTQGFKLGVLLFIIELIFMLAFGFASEFSEFGDALKNGVTDPSLSNNSFHPNETALPLFIVYMLLFFVGVSFHLSFIKNYCYGAIVYSWIIFVISMQLSILLQGLVGFQSGKIQLDVNQLTLGFNHVLPGMLTHFIMIGKLSPIQLVIVAVIELPLNILTFWIGTELLQAHDVAGVMFTHLFAACFGMCLSAAINKRGMHKNVNEDASYCSNNWVLLSAAVIFSLLPATNAIGSNQDGRTRAVVNTALATYGSLVGTFIAAMLVPSSCVDYDKPSGKRITIFNGKMHIAYAANSVFVGAIAIAGMADLQINGAVCIAIGLVSSIISVLGYRYITPWLNQYAHDTAGVLNVHGTPAMLGSILLAIYSGVANLETYGNNLYFLFPARAPDQNPPFSFGLRYAGTITLKTGQGKSRTGGTQFGFQIAAMLVVLGISSLGGFVLGIIFKYLNICDGPREEEYFLDSPYWELPSDGCHPVSDKSVVSTSQGQSKMPQENSNSVLRTDMNESAQTSYQTGSKKSFKYI